MEALEKGPDCGEETRVFLACVNVATGDLDEVLGLESSIKETTGFGDWNGNVVWTVQEKDGGIDLVDPRDRFKWVADEEANREIGIAAFAYLDH